MKPKQLTNINNWNYNRLLLYLLKNIQQIENYQFSQYRCNLLIFISLFHFKNMNCPCCGGKMEATDKDKFTIYKCIVCGLSNTELKKDIN